MQPTFPPPPRPSLQLIPLPSLALQAPRGREAQMGGGIGWRQKRWCYLNCNLQENFHLQANWKVHASHVQLL